MATRCASVASDGLSRARAVGIEAPHTGIDWISEHAAEIDLVFDATSAYVHVLAAFEAGATHIDGCTAGAGAGAGNCPTETLVTVCQKMGIDTGVQALALMDVAEEIVRPALGRPRIVDRAALTLRLAGVYGSFMLHSQRAAERYGVSQAEILLELGRRKAVGGQEDMIIDVTLELAARA
ncbi:MAG TPA: hypothetical protein VNF47_24755 [Streptosporangiaceae bacterium]|nr:hypothetical protein [Streptosporangiaceae bacterium]